MHSQLSHLHQHSTNIYWSQVECQAVSRAADIIPIWENKYLEMLNEVSKTLQLPRGEAGNWNRAAYWVGVLPCYPGSTVC